MFKKALSSFVRQCHGKAQNLDAFEETLQLSKTLERLSLVDFSQSEVESTLKNALQLADQIVAVNTDGVEPLVTVLEDR